MTNDLQVLDFRVVSLVLRRAVSDIWQVIGRALASYIKVERLLMLVSTMFLLPQVWVLLTLFAPLHPHFDYISACAHFQT